MHVLHCYCLLLLFQLVTSHSLCTVLFFFLLEIATLFLSHQRILGFQCLISCYLRPNISIVVGFRVHKFPFVIVRFVHPHDFSSVQVHPKANLN